MPCISISDILQTDQNKQNFLRITSALLSPKPGTKSSHWEPELLSSRPGLIRGGGGGGVQAQVKLPQSFPAIFVLSFSWVSICLFSVNLWLFCKIRTVDYEDTQSYVLTFSLMLPSLWFQLSHAGPGSSFFLCIPVWNFSTVWHFK